MAGSIALFDMDYIHIMAYRFKPFEINQFIIKDLVVISGGGAATSTKQHQLGAFLLAKAAEPIRLLYYPPYHSKYNPGERCWGILEKHGNGAKLTDTQTMLAWARSMTWKGLHPIVELSSIAYEKGIFLTKQTMKAVESRLERNPLLHKWDILIRPACVV